MLCFSKIPVAKSFWIRRGGEHQDSPSKIFCVAVPKYFIGESFSVSFISGIEKTYASEAYVTIFLRKSFCLTVPENFVGNPSVLYFRKLPEAKNFRIRSGGASGFSVLFFLYHSAKKLHR